jgi:hypothetical protein
VHGEADVFSLPRYKAHGSKHGAALEADCVSACIAAKKSAISAAAHYYQQDLPLRLQAEKESLADLTGWGMNRIETLPGASKAWGREAPVPPVPPPLAERQEPGQ